MKVKLPVTRYSHKITSGNFPVSIEIARAIINTAVNSKENMVGLIPSGGNKPAANRGSRRREVLACENHFDIFSQFSMMDRLKQIADSPDLNISDRNGYRKSDEVFKQEVRVHRLNHRNMPQVNPDGIGCNKHYQRLDFGACKKPVKEVAAHP